MCLLLNFSSGFFLIGIINTSLIHINTSFFAVDELAVELGDLDLAANHRAVTGVLLSHPDSRDVHIGTLSITFHGAELLVDTNLELNCGRRYGLIGLNGCGMLLLIFIWLRDILRNCGPRINNIELSDILGVSGIHFVL